MRRGLSFVEIMVAVAILSIVSMAVISAMSGSAREVKTTSEYSLSMFLSQKIVEDLIQSSHENLHFEDALADIGTATVDVANSVSPFFAALEDTKAPFGKLEAGQDLGVESADQTLFRLYRDFHLSMRTSDQALPPAKPGAPQAQVKNASMNFLWPGLKGVDRDYEFPITLAKPQVSPAATPLIAQDLPGFEDEVRKAIYPNETGSLSAVCASVGANRAAVMDVGAVMTLGEFAETNATTLQVTITALVAALPTIADPQAAGEARLQIAALYERKAAIRWFVLCYLKDPAGRQETAFKKSDLGSDTTKYSRVEVAGAVAEANGLLTAMKRDLDYATHHYATARQLFGLQSVRLFRRMMLERKILEMVKLKALVDEASDFTYLRQWLDYLLDVHTGRTRSFTQFLSVERSKTGSLAALEAANPQIAERCAEVRAAAASIERLSTRVTQEFSKL